MKQEQSWLLLSITYNNKNQSRGFPGRQLLTLMGLIILLINLFNVKYLSHLIASDISRGTVIPHTRNADVFSI